MKRVLATLSAVAAAATLAAHAPSAQAATPCVTGSVASTEGTSCTIGDLLFSFGTASLLHDPGHSLADFTFTPVVGLHSDGFTVTGSLTEAGGTTGINGGIFWDGVGVSTLSGLSTMVGLTTAITATVFTSPTGGGGNSDAQSSFQVASNISGEVVTADVNSTPSSGLFMPGPSAAGSGHVWALLESVGPGGTATATESRYMVNEAVVSSVPEPSEVSLLLGGLTILGGLATRKSLGPDKRKRAADGGTPS